MNLPDYKARLEIKGATEWKIFPINQSPVTIGRSDNNLLKLKEEFVSRHHAEIREEGDDYILVDLDSKDGTYLNGTKIKPKEPHKLKDGDIIKIAESQLKFSSLVDDKTAVRSEPVFEPDPEATQMASDTEKTILDSGIDETNVAVSVPLDLKGKNILSIGRDKANEAVIDHPSVSRFHAKITKIQGSYILEDLQSTNGTFVNGKLIETKRTLMVGDRIHIGPCSFIFQMNETLIVQNEEGKIRLDAVHLNKQVSPTVNLLNDISLSINAREFVVIAGVSGGGKSTLLDALNGFRPATSGNVLVNGTDLYKNFNAYRTEIGYVPQKDIVHTELSIYQALDFAAQLRMPPDTTPAERKKRVEEVLKDLGLSHRKDVPIKALSGGQLKRVSIGVELLTKPSLFFLDEATSGLDPGTEADMMQLLRQLADQGRTVLLITHATDNVMLCDLVVFLAAGGRIAYFGPPNEAVEYFNVNKFNEIYHKVERERTPEEWQKDYLQSRQYFKYVKQRQQSIEDAVSKESFNRPQKQAAGTKFKRLSPWQQLGILTKRNLAILMRDRASLILMLAIAPIIGLLDFVTWKPNMFESTKGDFGQVITMLFVTALVAVMVGSIATMRDIVKEVEIYRRERMIGLQVMPYIFSKVGIACIFALYQAAIFLLFKMIAIELPGGLSFSGMYLTLLLATISGMVMGLLVSAISPNQNIAPLLTIIVLIPQITFGGGMLPINTFGSPGKMINNITLTKWPFETLVTLTEVGKDVSEDPCWKKTEAEREKLTPELIQACNCYGTNVFKKCNFPGILSKYDPQIDQPEPQKPKEPGNPPPQPKQPDNPTPQAQKEYQDDLDQYQKDIDAYQKRVNDYQNAISQWQTKYSDWKGAYEKSKGEAEGVINRFNQDYGTMFNINISKYWSIMVSFIVAMLGLLFVIQKRKDVV